MIPYVYNKIDFNQVEKPRDVASKITQPLFLIHGKNDKLVPFENSEELIELVQSKEKFFEPFESDHNNRDEDTFKGIYDFILSYNNIKI